MSKQNVTIQLSDGLLQRATVAAASLQQSLEDVLTATLAAASLQQSLEDVLTATLAAALPEIQDIPADMQAELARMTWLSDADLWSIARTVISTKDQEQLRYLSELQSQRMLTENEEAKLDSLRRTYGTVMLRKARAYALLSLRGGRPLLVEN